MASVPKVMSLPVSHFYLVCTQGRDFTAFGQLGPPERKPDTRAKQRTAYSRCLMLADSVLEAAPPHAVAGAWREHIGRANVMIMADDGSRCSRADGFPMTVSR